MNLILYNARTTCDTPPVLRRVTQVVGDNNLKPVTPDAQTSAIEYGHRCAQTYPKCQPAHQSCREPDQLPGKLSQKLQLSRFAFLAAPSLLSLHALAIDRPHLRIVALKLTLAVDCLLGLPSKSYSLIDGWWQ